MDKKILVALDNSDYAERVMRQAIELAQLYKTSLAGISVIDNAYRGDCDESDPWACMTRDYWATAYQTVIDKCTEIANEKGICYSHEMVNGNPAEEIIKYAEKNNMDIVVLGHLGKTAAAGFTIGSVAQKVAAYSRSTVLIVK